MGKVKDKKTENVNGSNSSRAAGSVVGTIVNVLLIVAIILAFFCTYTAYETKKGSGVPSIMGIEPFSIQTDSMSPFVEAGDLVLDKKVDDISTLQKGDVITFWTIIEGERVLNTHRIKEVVNADNYTYFITKGDNNKYEDPMTVHQSEIVGKYWGKISGLGTVLDFLQTSKGFFCIVVLPVAAFFIYYLVNFFKVLFEYQAAKNRLKFEEEQIEKDSAEGAPTLDITKEQLMNLLEKAQAADTGNVDKPQNEEPVKEESKSEEESGTISMSKEELEAMIADAVKKAKEEER